MTKLLIFTFLLSSCALFDGAKTMLEGSYEAGKFAGRHEVLEALEENKKKLDPFLDLTIDQLIGLSKDPTSVAPVTLTILQLLHERNQLKKSLSEFATSSGAAK